MTWRFNPNTTHRKGDHAMTATAETLRTNLIGAWTRSARDAQGIIM